MIFNTAWNVDMTDFSGFLYSDGYKFKLRKTRDSDIHIYNECFVYTLDYCETKQHEFENLTDSDGNKLACSYFKVRIKSKSNGTYLDIDGNTTHVGEDDAPYLYIYPFDAAKISDAYNQNKGWDDGYLTENNKIKQAVVYSESENYAKVYPHEVSSKNKVFIVSDKDISEDANMTDAKYWSGTQNAFTSWETGHPFAFYEAVEETSNDELNMQDLHIYSRCDLYSAQKIYGLVQDAGKIKSMPNSDDYPNGYTGEGIFNNLIDGDQYSYNITDWRSNSSETPHCYQIDLGKSVDELRLYMKKRPDGKHAPTSVEVWASATEDGAYTKVAETASDALSSKYELLTDALELNGSYQYIRIYAPGRTNSEQCIALSELYVLPNIKLIEDSKTYLDASLPVSATAQEFQDIIDTYNSKVPDVRLLSGVPIPGNKYRIYADTYSGGTYVSLELKTDGTDLTTGGTYLELADEAEKEKYEWVCEQTSDGKLVFRSVLDATKYLANGVVTDNFDAGKWTISTNSTRHHGVPLWNGQKYLAITSDGEWRNDIATVQDQTAVQTNDNGTPDDTTDDVTYSVCTDFVFLPVEVDDDEIRVTIDAEDLVQRNSTLTFDGVSYTMPFSRIFKKTDQPAITMHCSSIHYYAKCLADGVEDNNVAQVTDNVITFSFDEKYANKHLEVKFAVEPPFSHSDETEKVLYRIKNMKPVNAVQAVAPQRSSDVPIDGGGQISTARYKYAKFDTKSTNMVLIDETLTPAESFFYFTTGDAADAEYKRSFIHSAVTTMKFAAVNEWNEAGRAYYVLPNVTANNYAGYAITQTMLNSNNNPNGLKADFTSATAVMGYVEDDEAAWMFELVEEDVAKESLKTYIKAKIEEIYLVLSDPGYGYSVDDNKRGQYESHVDAIYKATIEDENNVPAEADVTTLVEKAQELHMIEHEVHYSLQALPEVSDENKMDAANGFANPHWYYVKNVKSEHYATYNGAEDLMQLAERTDSDKKDMTLANLFYIAGDIKTDAVDNSTIVDKYFEGHIHNFMALNDTTLLGQNEVIFENIKFEGAGGESSAKEEHLKLGQTLDSDTWEISAEFHTDGSNANHYGTVLLAGNPTDGEPTASVHKNGFQVFMLSSGYIVFKAGDVGGDQYCFKHTEGANSYVKVVVTWAKPNISISVTNSLGQTLSLDDTENRWDSNNKNTQDYIVCSEMKPIESLMSYFPPVGVTIESLKGENVLAMKWDKHEEGNPEKDKWFILPSSNTEYLGLAIVMDGADDNNMGWAKKADDNSDIFINNGYNDSSTWQFERVTNFDSHLDELLAAYGMDNVVIYKKELVDFYNIIEKGKAIIYDDAYNGTAAEEAAFNEIYTAFNSYTGPEAAELKAPKPGKFYTIHHVPASMPNDFMVSDRNVVKVGEDTDTADGCISRGVWCFEGTESDGFLALDGDLKLKSLHTLSYPYADGFTADSLKLSDEESAAVEIEKVRAAQVRLKVNSNYLATGADAKNNYIVTNADALATPNYVGTTFSHEGGANVQASSAKYDNVAVSTTLAATQDGSNIDAFKTGGSITSSILCPAQRASDTESPEFIFTLTYTGLPAGFAFNNVGLDIHALNGSGNYQYNTEGATVPRQWNVAIAVAEDEGEYTEFGGFTDTDIAAGVGTSGNVHKVWNFAKDGGYTKAGDGKLKVKITVTKGTTNKGCFFGLSSVELSNSDARHDQWYIEEVENPESIYHSMSTASAGHATLMLGFPALIPGEVEAFRGVKHGPMGNVQYFSMVSYGEPGEIRILPANTPVVVRNTDASATEKDVKFFYRKSDAERENDNYLRGSLYYKVVNAQAHDNTNPITSALDGQDVNIYMLQTNKGTSKFYWIYEEASSDGTIAPGNANTDNGGYVVCNANKAYLILPAATTSVTSYSLRFSNGETTDIGEVFDGANENEVEQVETIYDLSGRKLTEITAPGVYIVNGKKVLVK